ncbi:uncharacterized protein BDZ99DRAFT_556929 [Mytilinidion resinicola]|uniref:Uncharacterized protein n=1 Tax=Mytilinidion resinicola TaxID=574789 RepID=A0A6A6YX68_9PEZI|nr:uncharacterized protein BDZ99DRAFT_556929 [Mytilinidion resinicola]KAF2813370.1 hypothetical protein BDZ99DRAFT_556929 [Mytilinidion resinicola]
MVVTPAGRLCHASRLSRLPLLRTSPNHVRPAPTQQRPSLPACPSAPAALAEARSLVRAAPLQSSSPARPAPDSGVAPAAADTIGCWPLAGRRRRPSAAPGHWMHALRLQRCDSCQRRPTDDDNDEAGVAHESRGGGVVESRGPHPKHWDAMALPSSTGQFAQTASVGGPATVCAEPHSVLMRLAWYEYLISVGENFRYLSHKSLFSCRPFTATLRSSSAVSSSKPSLWPAKIVLSLAKRPTARAAMIRASILNPTCNWTCTVNLGAHTNIDRLPPFPPPSLVCAAEKASGVARGEYFPLPHRDVHCNQPGGYSPILNTLDYLPPTRRQLIQRAPSHSQPGSVTCFRRLFAAPTVSGQHSAVGISE